MFLKKFLRAISHLIVLGQLRKHWQLVLGWGMIVTAIGVVAPGLIGWAWLPPPRVSVITWILGSGSFLFILLNSYYLRRSNPRETITENARLEDMYRRFREEERKSLPEAISSTLWEQWQSVRGHLSWVGFWFPLGALVFLAFLERINLAYHEDPTSISPTHIMIPFALWLVLIFPFAVLGMGRELREARVLWNWAEHKFLSQRELVGPSPGFAIPPSSSPPTTFLPAIPPSEPAPQPASVENKKLSREAALSPEDTEKQRARKEDFGV